MKRSKRPNISTWQVSEPNSLDMVPCRIYWVDRSGRRCWADALFRDDGWDKNLRIVPTSRFPGYASDATAPVSCEKDDTDIYTPQEVAKGRRLYGVAAAKKAARELRAGDGRHSKTKCKPCGHGIVRAKVDGGYFCLRCREHLPPSPRPRG